MNGTPTYPRGNPVMNVLRTAIAGGLLGLQLLFVLFVLEIPYFIADRLFARHRGDAFYRAQRSVARWFLRLYPFGTYRRINARPQSFPRPCVIVSNHQSLIDGLLLLTLPVNARWFIKAWTLRIPLMGELSKFAGHLPIDDDEGDRLKGFDSALERLGQGVSILAFPEGSRSPDCNLMQFRSGVFRLAIEAGAPIVPVVLDGTGAALPKGSLLVRRANVVVKVLAPISTVGMGAEADADRLAAQVHALVASELQAWRALRRKPGVPHAAGWVTRIVMLTAALVIACATGLSIYVSNWCIAQPPAYRGDRSLAGAEIRELTLDDRRIRRLGDSWRRRRDGVNELALKGDDWQRGYANARLTQDLLQAQETHLLGLAREFLPQPGALWLMKHLVSVNNRDLPLHLSHAEQLEVLGLAEGGVDLYPDEGLPLYHRVLNYHAAHDISHLLIDTPLVARRELIGCSALAAWGDAAEEGDLWVARNFDWEAGSTFDREKCVLYVWPDGGIPYAHVAWAGMAGAVTGMNAEGLSVHINAARTEETRFGSIGTPVSILVRRVLEQARTIEQAFAIIRDARVFVSDSYLVASRNDHRAVVIEKSPRHCSLRQPAKPGVILQTNHFMGDEWKGDRVHREQLERATTLYRWQRLDELADEHLGRMNAQACLAILRDRKGRGGKEIGIGNRNTIDAGICAHSVIMNVSTGEMWVSAGPHTYGEYVYVPVAEMLRGGPAGALRTRTDPGRNLRRGSPGEADDLDEFRRKLKLARNAVQDDDVGELEPLVRTLVNLNPNSFETAWYQGHFAYLKKEYADAARNFETALQRDPHYEETREQIRIWLNRAREKAR